MSQVDDILIYGKTQTPIVKKTVLEKLKQANITLNEAKFQFNVSSVNFLGQVIDKEGLKPDLEKVSATEEFAQPTDMPGIHLYLGMANFLAKFVPELATKTKPLRDLLVKDKALTRGNVSQK